MLIKQTHVKLFSLNVEFIFIIDPHLGKTKTLFAIDKLQTILFAHGGLREFSGTMMLFSREQIVRYTFYLILDPFWMSPNPAMQYRRQELNNHNLHILRP